MGAEHSANGSRDLLIVDDGIGDLVQAAATLHRNVPRCRDSLELGGEPFAIADSGQHGALTVPKLDRDVTLIEYDQRHLRPAVAPHARKKQLGYLTRLHSIA